MQYPQRAVLFDLDGTLIDTTQLILECFRHSWMKVCGLSHSREALIRTFGTPLRSAMHQLLQHSAEGSANGVRRSEFDDGLVEQLLIEYRSYNVANHDRLAKAFDGTREMLFELRRRGYSIAVVSSKSRELALRGLGLCFLDGLIDSGIYLEDTDVHKPHPQPILAALKLLKAPARSTAYVGDSRHDLVAARAAGVKAVAAMWGPAPREELERERPDFIAEHPGQLLQIFN